MQQALREADVLVHLSTIDSFPLIVLEALAAGTLPLVFPMAGSRRCWPGSTGWSSMPPIRWLRGLPC
jgi:hypothetical protein